MSKQIMNEAPQSLPLGGRWHGEAVTEGVDRESNEIKKSMAYDLIDIIESAEGKESYTPEEIKALIKAYITGMSQK